MKILVVGGGAVGSFLASRLAYTATGGATPEHHVTLLRRRASQSGPMRLAVHGPAGERSTSELVVARSTGEVDWAVDLVVLAIRAHDVPRALDSLPPLPSVTLLSVQNGIGTEETIRERRPDLALVAASLTASLELVEDAQIAWLRRGGIGLASVNGGDALIPQLASIFGRAGLHARAYVDWRAMKWSKLVANLVGNATSGLLQMGVDRIYTDASTFPIERDQLREAFAVMEALGLKPVALPGADIRALRVALALPAPIARPILRVAVGGGRGGKDPSLLLAMAAGADTTEVRWLNGAVVKYGAQLGVPTPVNTALTELVERTLVDADLRDRLRHRPPELVEAVAHHPPRTADADLASNPR